MRFVRLLCAVMLWSCWAVGAASAASGMIWNRGNGSEPETLDPHRSTGVPESHIERDLFEGLVAESADGRIMSGAAQRWDISADGLVYTFHLRPNARWSNGATVTAQDFVYSFRRVVDPATESKNAYILAPLLNAEKIASRQLADTGALGVRAIDDQTLELRLERPTPYFLSLLSLNVSYPVYRSAVEKTGSGWGKSGEMISNGPFRLDSWWPNRSITLTRNPFFHDAPNVALDAVVFYPVDNVYDEFKRYRAGEIDSTYNALLPHQLAWAKANAADELKQEFQLGTYYLALNLAAAPFRDNPGLRRALSLAIDRDLLIDQVTKGGEIPAYGWVPPATANFPKTANPEAKRTQAERDVEARRLFAESGTGRDRPLELEVLYNASEMNRRIVLAIAAMWEAKLGVKARFVQQDWETYLATGAQRKYQVYRASWMGDYNDPTTFLDLLTAEAGVQNVPGYRNPKYDALLNQAARVTNLAQRGGILAEAEAMMLADQPLIPIYYYASKSLLKPYILGWKTNILDIHPSRWVSINRVPIDRRRAAPTP